MAIVTAIDNVVKAPNPDCGWSLRSSFLQPANKIRPILEAWVAILNQALTTEPLIDCDVCVF
jgi:hypothetical protein